MPISARFRQAFTLIELICVLALLAIIATFVASSMSGFFRGRVLNFEARRMLSLTHFAQSRAVSEGMPMILWLNPTNSTYGLSAQSSFTDADSDLRPIIYSIDPMLALVVPAGGSTPESENGDETLGLNVDGLAFIRFTPDGFFDDTSVRKITIQQGAQDGLELVPMANRLAYEIRPASHAD